MPAWSRSTSWTSPPPKRTPNSARWVRNSIPSPITWVALSGPRRWRGSGRTTRTSVSPQPCVRRASSGAPTRRVPATTTTGTASSSRTAFRTAVSVTRGTCRSSAPTAVTPARWPASCVPAHCRRFRRCPARRTTSVRPRRTSSSSSTRRTRSWPGMRWLLRARRICGPGRRWPPTRGTPCPWMSSAL
jgi:hypothetical protein